MGVGPALRRYRQTLAVPLVGCVRFGSAARYAAGVPETYAVGRLRAEGVPVLALVRSLIQRAFQLTGAGFAPVS